MPVLRLARRGKGNAYTNCNNSNFFNRMLQLLLRCGLHWMDPKTSKHAMEYPKAMKKPVNRERAKLLFALMIRTPELY